jgi:hypothetical protein
VTRSLLIIACSQRKTAGMAAGTAWDIYDGVIYRMLKKRLGPQDHWPAGLDVLIVSARYGVIRPTRRIETYDQAMPPNGRPGRWAGRLRHLVADREYHFVHVNLGRAYRGAIGDLAGLFPQAEVTMASGGIGWRAAQTLAWMAARVGTEVSAATD